MSHAVVFNMLYFSIGRWCKYCEAGCRLFVLPKLSEEKVESRGTHFTGEAFIDFKVKMLNLGFYAIKRK